MLLDVWIRKPVGYGQFLNPKPLERLKRISHLFTRATRQGSLLTGR